MQQSKIHEAALESSVERERQTGNVKLLFRKNYCTFDNVSITFAKYSKIVSEILS